MHPDGIDLLLVAFFPLIAIFAWFIGPAFNSILRWWEERQFSKASRIADEMWKSAEAGQHGDELPPPPRPGLRMVGKERGDLQ